MRWLLFLVAATAALAQEPVAPQLALALHDGRTHAVAWEGDEQLGKIVTSLSKAGGGTITFSAGIYTFERGVALKGIRNVHFVGQPGCVFRLRRLDEFGRVLVSADSPMSGSSLVVDHPELLRAGHRYQLLKPDLAGNRFLELEIESIEGNVVKFDPGTHNASLKTVPKGSIVLPQINFFDGVSCGDMSFSGITFDGNFDVPTAVFSGNRFIGHTTHCGLLFRNRYKGRKGATVPRPAARHIAVTRCRFVNLLGRGVTAYNVEGVLVRDCEFENMGAEGVEIDHLGSRARILGCTFTDLKMGMRLNDCNDVVVGSCILTGCNVGIHVTRSLKQAGLNRNIVIHGNVLRGGRTGIVMAKNAAECVISGNSFAGTETYAITVLGDHNAITGNTISGGGPGAIRILGGDNVVADNCIIEPRPRPASWVPIRRN